MGPASKLKMAAEAVHRTYYRCRERRAQSRVASLFLDKRRKHRHRRTDGDCWLLLPGTASKPRNTRSANAMTAKILRQAKRLMAANKKMSAAATQRGKDAPHITPAAIRRRRPPSPPSPPSRPPQRAALSPCASTITSVTINEHIIQRAHTGTTSMHSTYH